ncbi:Kinesin member [Perkinsus olseni]|uniref:Kinesin member n=1 Tax=Perkinsus olseni TaxID=32597 RepID=A0A7J6PYB7_PEROL|nr:Kinesin member [Perkinsus olseni]
MGQGWINPNDVAFAHAESELRSLPNLTKTAICYEQVYGKCGCKNGARCKYAHSEEELRKYVPQGVPPGRQFNSKSPGHPRYGSGDSTSWLKRRGSRTSEGPYITCGGGRRYSKESISSGIKLGSPKPKPLDLPALRAKALEIARELPASTGKHLEISRGQLVDNSDDPCIEQYLCSICGALASPTPDPTIASACTHVTCARCFEGWRRANVEQEPKLKTLPCPSCGCPLRKGIDVFPLDESVEGPIAALRRVYSKIQIGCNKTDDVTSIPCTWIGSVRDFPEHMVVCHHWECLLKTLPSFPCKEEEDAEGDTTPHRDQAPHFYDVLDDTQERGPASAAQVNIAPIWDDISPTGRPSGQLKPPTATTTTTTSAAAGTLMANTGFNEQVLILSPPPARGIDSYGDRPAAASPSTTATIPGAPGSIWAPQQVDTYSATSSNCSEMIASISPDNFFPSATGNCLGEDSDNTAAKELDPAYCEAICAFVPYGSSADKMMEMSEGEALLYSSVTDDGQWSLVKRVATGDLGWVPTGCVSTARYLQVASDLMSPRESRSLGYNAALTPENSKRPLTESKKGGSHGVDNQADQWHFQVDRLLINSSQQDVYKYAARDLVGSAFDGVNAAIIAYGHTGAGKTYTMVGSTSSYEHRGIIPRVLADIFKEKEERPAMSIDIRLSYLEIYNEALADLLGPPDVDVVPGDSITSDLTLYEDPTRGVQIKGLRRVPVESEEDALSVFYTGESHRAMGRKEVSSINRSCTYLEQVVLALASKNRDHVPYRQSKLTYILKDSLGGNCKSALIAAIWPEARHFEETASSAGWGARPLVGPACDLRSVNQCLDENAQVPFGLRAGKYEKDIKQLQQELEMHDILAGRHRVQYDDYTPEEVEELERKLLKYLTGEDADFEVESIRQVTEAFKIARQLYQSISSEAASLREAAGDGWKDTEADVSAEQENSANAPETGISGGVGDEVKEGMGFSVGLVEGNGAPPSTTPISNEEGVGTDGVREQSKSPQATPSRQAIRAEVRTVAGSVNSAVDEIERMKIELARLQGSGAERETDESGNIILDEDEYRLLRDLTEVKKRYRSMLEKHRGLEDELLQCQREVADNKKDVLDNFAVWFLKEYGGAPFVDANAPISGRDNQSNPRLDIGEQFDSLESARVQRAHPDAVPFYRATKANRLRTSRK